jgi:hypothetical protein
MAAAARLPGWAPGRFNWLPVATARGFQEQARCGRERDSGRGPQALDERRRFSLVSSAPNTGTARAPPICRLVLNTPLAVPARCAGTRLIRTAVTGALGSRLAGHAAASALPEVHDQVPALPCERPADRQGGLDYPPPLSARFLVLCCARFVWVYLPVQLGGHDSGVPRRYST